MTKKPYKGEIAQPQFVHLTKDNEPYQKVLYGPNLGFIVRGNFRNHPVFRGLNSVGAQTSLVVKYNKRTGRLETLNTIYKVLKE